MKKLFTLLLSLSFIGSVYSQDKLPDYFPLNNGKVVYNEEVAVPNMSKSEIFRRARRWYVLMYNSPDQVLKLNDEATGELIARGFGEAVAPALKKIDEIRFYLHSETQFDAKENGYHIKIDNIIVQRSFGHPKVPIEVYKSFPKKNLPRIQEASNKMIRDYLASLNKYILTEQFDQ